MIQSVAVLGAGTMGAQIAAHAANAGLPVLLLDVTADAAQAGLARAEAEAGSVLRAEACRTHSHRQLRRRAWETPARPTGSSRPWSRSWTSSKRCSAGSRRTSAPAPSSRRTPRASRSSRLPRLHRRGEVRRRFLGTHFFNPPRYLPLVELIPAADTDPAVVDNCARSWTSGSARAS
jgi:3-hydroxyacyl-CoA dehydrogenase